MPELILVLATVPGILAGALAAWRWPAGPRLSEETIRREVRLHPAVAALLRRRLDPDVATGLALTVAVIVVVVCMAGVGALLAMVRAETGLVPSDRELAAWAAANVPASSAELLRLVSRLGGTGAVVALAVVTWAIEHRRGRSWAVPAMLVLAIGGQFAVVNLVKWAVDRARPDVGQLTGFAGASFPSGHAAAAACCYATFALLLGRGRSRPVRTVLAAAAGGVAGAVAATRVLLGVHWLTDVLAGALVGWTWFALCSVAFGGRLLSFGAPTATAGRVAEGDR